MLFLLSSPSFLTGNHLIKQRENKGFALIELVVVIAVLSILMGIAIPTFNNLRKTAMINALKINITTLVKQCLADSYLNDRFPSYAAYKDIGYSESSLFSDNGGLDHGSKGYSYYFISLGFNNPLTLESNCMSISAKADNFPGTKTPALPHFQIFYNSGAGRFERLCDVASKDTFNNGTCDTTAPRWRQW